MLEQVSEELLWSQIVARAWSDEGFMKRLRSEPRSVLAEHGMELPEGTEVQVVEDAEVNVVQLTDTVRHFTLPFSPPEELTYEDLGRGPVAQCFSGWCGACGVCGRCACRCRCRCF
jgi:hypothetical protein